MIDLPANLGRGNKAAANLTVTSALEELFDTRICPPILLSYSLCL